MSDAIPIRGRGAVGNPANRFEPLHLERDTEWDPAEDPAPRTRFYKDQTSAIITYNDSPDIGFDASINPYRGCEHGCIYCYARPTHEYLGFSIGLDFESRIIVKDQAPERLRQELSSPRWKPQVIALSGATDCYQPVERRLQLTRRCLAVLAEFRNPVRIATKNDVVTRDLDHLTVLAQHQAAAVFFSITTLDKTLAQKLEPRTSSPQRRLTAMEKLSQAGVPVGVLVAPIIPALTDHEIPQIIAAVAQAGARYADMEILRLPLGLGPLFEDWLQAHFPERREKILNRLRSMRHGKLNDPRFGYRMRGEGVLAEQIDNLFTIACRRSGLVHGGPDLSTASFRVPGGEQLLLFSSAP